MSRSQRSPTDTGGAGELDDDQVMSGGVETPEVGVEIAGDEFKVGPVAEGEEAPSTGKGNRTVVERHRRCRPPSHRRESSSWRSPVSAGSSAADHGLAPAGLGVGLSHFDSDVVGEGLGGERSMAEDDSLVAFERDHRGFDTVIGWAGVDDQVDPVTESLDDVPPAGRIFELALGGDGHAGCRDQAHDRAGHRRRRSGHRW